jgi:hypothetical protein
MLGIFTDIKHDEYFIRTLYKPAEDMSEIWHDR